MDNNQTKEIPDLLTGKPGHDGREREDQDLGKQSIDVIKLDGNDRQEIMNAFQPGNRFVLNGVLFVVQKKTRKDLVCRPVALVKGKV